MTLVTIEYLNLLAIRIAEDYNLEFDQEYFDQTFAFNDSGMIIEPFINKQIKTSDMVGRMLMELLLKTSEDMFLLHGVFRTVTHVHFSILYHFFFNIDDFSYLDDLIGLLMMYDIYHTDLDYADQNMSKIAVVLPSTYIRVGEKIKSLINRAMDVILDDVIHVNHNKKLYVYGLYKRSQTQNKINMIHRFTYDDYLEIKDLLAIRDKELTPAKRNALLDKFTLEHILYSAPITTL